MTFFKINDPKNRELIKEVIAKRAVIREADRRRKMGEAFEFEQLSRFFKPITKQAEKMTEKIEKGVKGLPGEIAKVLPQPINLFQPMQPMQPMQQMITPMLTTHSMQPTYPIYEDETDTETEKTDETDYMDKKEISNFIKFKDGYYNFGKFPIKFKKNGEIEVNVKGKFEKFSNSSKIYELFTNKNSKITWDDLDEKEQKDLGFLSVLSDIFYDSNTGKKKENCGKFETMEKYFFSYLG